jgi:hypothetical protein
MYKKVIAIDIFELNNWYRFNVKTITNEMLIDFEQPINIGQIGMFAEEHDVFFAQLPNNITDFKKENLYIVPFEVIEALIPLSENAVPILSARNPNLTFAIPLEKEYCNRITQERNHYLSKAGGELILKIFGIQKEIVVKYERDFLTTMQKYPEESMKNSSNLFDCLVYYKREKPYPIINSGFLFDVGTIGKDYLSDKINTEYTDYARFCKNNEKEERIFSKFQKEYEQNKKLRELNEELSFKVDEANNILIMAFYLKFRKLVQDKKYPQFEEEAKVFLKNTEKETAIALFMVGMFFGSTEFVELYYQKYLPLLKREEKTTSIISTVKEIIPQVAEPITEYKKDEKNLVFDKNLLAKIQKELVGKITDTTKKKITSIFEEIQPDLFNSDTSIGDLSKNFISALEHELKVKMAKGKYSKKEIIDKIKEVLSIV